MGHRCRRDSRAAAPKKTIPLSLRKGEWYEKLALDAAAMSFQDPWKEVGGRWDHLGETIVLGELDWNQTGVHSQPPGGQKTNSE
jgi:hypothetical protein